MKKIGILVLSLGLVIGLSAFINNSDPWDIPAEYESMENPVEADKESLAIGKQLYNKHCKSCHGAEGYGDGPKADELETEMTDLSVDEYKAQKPGVKYYKSIIGKGDMPNYEKKIPDVEDRWCVINYMDTFE
jgi:mono/diheme cytochrome c family protein